MEDNFQFFDILLFALVAIFLVLRLRNVLGRRDGFQPPQKRDPFAQPAGPEAAAEDKVVRLPERPVEPVGAPAEPPTHEPAAHDLGGLAQVRLADPRFDERQFVEGAKVAFEMIITAFAAGDTGTLKPLLSEEVFANFAQSIREREQQGHRQEISLVAIKSAEIVDAYMGGRHAHITVRFVTDQIVVERDNDGHVIEGTPDAVSEVTDTWTFARDTRSSDPNWTLVATGAADID